MRRSDEGTGDYSVNDLEKMLKVNRSSNHRLAGEQVEEESRTEGRESMSAG